MLAVSSAPDLVSLDVGGIETVVRIARDLAPEIELSGLTQSLNAMGQVPVAQRLGYILDRLSMSPRNAWLTGSNPIGQ